MLPSIFATLNTQGCRVGFHAPTARGARDHRGRAGSPAAPLGLGGRAQSVYVYAPISGPERVRFFQQASAFFGSLDPRECLVLGGDFNCTLEERDRTGIELSLAATDVFREIVAHHSLVDVGATTTWTMSLRLLLSGWRNNDRATPSWIAFIFLAVIFHRPTPPAFGQPRSQTTIWSAVGGKGAKKYVLCLLVEDGAPSWIRWRCVRGPGPSTLAFSPQIQLTPMPAECFGTNSRRSAQATGTSWSCLSLWPSS
ncbi:unnamed protein product [Natator depressus]